MTNEPSSPECINDGMTLTEFYAGESRQDLIAAYDAQGICREAAVELLGAVGFAFGGAHAWMQQRIQNDVRQEAAALAEVRAYARQWAGSIGLMHDRLAECDDKDTTTLN